MNVYITDKWIALTAAQAIDRISPFKDSDRSGLEWFADPMRNVITVRYHRFTADVPRPHGSTKVEAARREIEDAVYGLVFNA